MYGERDWCGAMSWPHTERRGLHTTTTHSIDQSQSRFYLICVLIGQKRCALGYFRQSVTAAKKTTHREVLWEFQLLWALSLFCFAQQFIALRIPYFVLCIISLLCKTLLCFSLSCPFFSFPRATFPQLSSASSLVALINFYLLCATFPFLCLSSRWSWIRFWS